jgi:SecD/SecF fusion protein
MNRNLFWKSFLVLFVLGWALYELYPPTGRNVIDVFAQRADRQRRDAAFTNIVNRARELDKQLPDRAYANLRDAVGTNDATRYFPWVDVKGETDPNARVLQFVQQEAAGKIRLGLDLRGGTSFLVEMDTTNIAAVVERETALENAVEVLRRRVDRLGVAEPTIQPAGENRILIQLPGLSEADKETAKRQIQKAAFLEFRMVHPESAQLIEQGIAEPGYEVLSMQEENPDRTKRVVKLLINKKAERGMNGRYVKRSYLDRDPLSNKLVIGFELDSEGARLFGEITTEHKGRQLAIVLDGELESAPVIEEPIPNGRGIIRGDFTPEEAVELANVLENPLEAPVKIVEERSVDPSLGKDSIKSGVRASAIGAIAVSVFMLVYYLLAGLVANVALILNIIILLGAMCSFDSVLTMPGIAGIVLTIGMAVDANVLIFERIREELAAGKSPRGALNAGYNKAFGTIFDSNITTLIASVILIFMGTGPVKGFGVTLSIGIGVSMFSALFATRIIFDFLLGKGWLTSIPMLSIVGKTKIDFLRWAKPAFAVSWLLILIGIGFGINRGRDVLGYEFVGGDNMTLAFAKKIDVDQLRNVIGKLGVGDVMIQYQKDLPTGRENLLVTTRAEIPKPGQQQVDSADAVLAALQKNFPDSGLKRIGIDKVGPTVGKEIQRTALIATLLALFGILVYVAFRYEFSFAVASVVAIFHDIFMTLGWFFLTGRELSAPMVAAILTIIGFSINDTIVIFDRIREDLKMGVHGSFKDVINRALNETLSRTIITSGTVFLSTLSLYLFGGGVINDFAFTFLVGILSGTFSTIYIASALVLWWHKGQRPRMSAQPLTGGAGLIGPREDRPEREPGRRAARAQA